MARISGLSPQRFRLTRSAVTIAVVAVAIAGLLSAPVLCACGAVVPHQHSLFFLDGHHHGHGGHPHDGSAAGIDCGAVDGPTLHAPELPLTGKWVATVLAATAVLATRPARAGTFPPPLPLQGRSLAPDAPPPRR